MSWTSWIPRIAGYVAAPFTGGVSIPIGEGIAQGVTAHDAINKADATQQAGTAQAMAPQQQATRASGDAYTQQRADTQNLFGQPYQTLGSLMGLNIAPIGAPMGSVPTSNNPNGGPASFRVGGPLTVQPGNWTPTPGAPLPFKDGELTTLAQLAAATPSNRKLTSQSSYAGRRT